MKLKSKMKLKNKITIQEGIIMSNKPKFNYTTSNHLAHYLKIKKAQKTAESGGKKILLQDVEAELAEYCGLARNSVMAIKRELSQPSLPVAFKIAEYFGVRIDDIFIFRELTPEELEEIEAKNG